MSKLRVAVLGAGPVGLEAALHARQLGYTVNIFEQGQVAEQVNRWGHVRMFSPFEWNSTPMGRKCLKTVPDNEALLTGAEYRAAYLLPLAEQLKDCLQLHTTVLTIGRVGWRKTHGDPKKPLPPFRLLVRNAQNQERFEIADVILDCCGVYARPNWAGDGGIPAAGEIASRPQIMYWNDDILGTRKAVYAGKSVILIGDGYSAATTMISLASLAEEHQSTWVFWLCHGPKGAPLRRIANDPLRERDRLAAKANSLACRCDGNLEFHALTHVEEIFSHGPDKGFRVAGRRNGEPVNWEVDRVIANVGYRPDPVISQELRVNDGGEPNYFVLGAKSAGRGSDFLLRDGLIEIERALQRVGNSVVLKAA